MIWATLPKIVCRAGIKGKQLVLDIKTDWNAEWALGTLTKDGSFEHFDYPLAVFSAHTLPGENVDPTQKHRMVLWFGTPEMTMAEVKKLHLPVADAQTVSQINAVAKEWDKMRHPRPATAIATRLNLIICGSDMQAGELVLHIKDSWKGKIYSVGITSFEWSQHILSLGVFTDKKAHYTRRHAAVFSVQCPGEAFTGVGMYITRANVGKQLKDHFSEWVAQEQSKSPEPQHHFNAAD